MPKVYHTIKSMNSYYVMPKVYHTIKSMNSYYVMPKVYHTIKSMNSYYVMPKVYHTIKSIDSSHVRLEVQQLRRTRWIQACLFGPYYLVPQLAIFLFAVVLVLTDREQDISPGTVFMLMGLVQALRLTCGMYLPVGSQHLAETLVVIRRIQVTNYTSVH